MQNGMRMVGLINIWPNITFGLKKLAQCTLGLKFMLLQQNNYFATQKCQKNYRKNNFEIKLKKYIFL